MLDNNEIIIEVVVLPELHCAAAERMDPEPTSGCQAGQLSRGIWRRRLKNGLSGALLPKIGP